MNTKRVNWIIKVSKVHNTSRNLKSNDYLLYESRIMPAKQLIVEMLLVTSYVNITY